MTDHNLDNPEKHELPPAPQAANGQHPDELPWVLSEQELHRQLRDMAALTAVSLVLNSTLDPEEVLRIVVSAVTQVIGCQKSAVLDLDHTATLLCLRMSHGLGDDFVQAVQQLPVDDWWADVIATGEMVAVGDVAAEPGLAGFAPLAEAEGIRALVHLPLVVQGQIVGALAVYFTELRTLSEFELELLSIFANQAATAIHNARLYSRLERRVRELSGLAQIEEALAAGLHLERLLAGLAEGLCRVLDAAGGVILLWNPRRGQGERGAAVGLSRRILHLLENKPDELQLVNETVARQQALLVQELEASDLVGPLLTAQLDFEQLLSLPLMTGGRVVGVMVLGDPRWTDQESLDRALLTAQHVALAISNALLFEEMNRHARDLMTLGRAARTVASPGRLDVALGQLLQQLEDIVPADRLVIYLCSEGDESLTLAAFRGQSPAGESALEDATFQALLERVVQQKRTLLLPEEDTAEDEPAAEYAASLLLLPLVYEARCLGVLALEHQQADAFGEREQSLAASFADHAALAVENARRYEAALQERNLIQTIVAGMADGVVVTDAGDTVVMCNQAAEEMLGIQVGSLWFTDLPSSKAAGIEHPAARGEGTTTTLKRGNRVLSVSTTRLSGNGGVSQGAMYVVRDITQWAEQDQIKSDFISQVSHDLRTPLTTVKTLVDLLRKGGQDSQKVREYLDIIEAEVNRQIQLVNDLLEMGQLETGEVSWTVVEVSVDEVAEQAIRACLPLAEEKDIALTGLPLPRLPKIMGTPRRLQQVLVNLLSNAVKYTPPGGQVGVEAGSDEETVWVAVRDTGSGIPKADLPHVFDKFYRLRRDRHSQEGVGLGLAIAWQIVKAFNGTIEVESQEGQGSCFTVRLPRAGKMVAAMKDKSKGS